MSGESHEGRSQSGRKTGLSVASGAGIGMIFGAAFGAVAIGLVLGAAVGALFSGAGRG